MDIKIKISIYCCIAACIFTVSLPLISELTYRGEGSLAGASKDSDIFLIVDSQTTLEDPQTEYSTTEYPITEYSTTEGASPDSSYYDTEETNLPIKNENISVSVLNSSNNSVSTLSLEEYIIGVVAAEMPYTFNTEALKAQAVAARSYCIYKMMYGSGHNQNIDICTDNSHCAAYISEKSLKEKYGESTSTKIIKKISEAVNSTAGEIITYKGEPALALFHSRSWKSTESSENVWGQKIPYLVSVSTPEDDSISTVTVSESILKQAFLADGGTIKLSSQNNLLSSTVNSSGRQDILSYCGKQLKAKDLRSLIGLKSCSFEYQKTSTGWEFTVHGYGHGVGMSQYGANQMAKNGSSYTQILTHYYSGVSISQLY